MRAHARSLVLAAALALAGAPAAAAVSVPPPTVTGPVGDHGWYVGDVTVKWAPSGETHSEGCDTALLTADTKGTPITCTASDAGGSAHETVVIRIDRTPPAGVAAIPARPPDHPPYYTAPLAISWSGSDATSGIAACTALTYAGPDNPAAAATGVCRDQAGNVSPPVGLGLAYDATAPALTDVTATAASDDTVAVRFTPGADVQSVAVVRQPGAATVLDGPPPPAHQLLDGPLAPRTTYSYAVIARDAAGNATTASAAATTPPAPPPTLRWKARPRARYYNLQLFRNGHKILSAWPTATHYTLKASWRFRGRTRKLTPGRYRWYVWPGYGRRAAHRYGRLHAKGAVQVPAQRP